VRIKVTRISRRFAEAEVVAEKAGEKGEEGETERATE
jgi:hypothetical protein